jgi:Na+/H+-dicarboxylate symporter
MFRTATNVTGDMAAAVILTDRREGDGALGERESGKEEG